MKYKIGDHIIGKRGIIKKQKGIILGSIRESETNKISYAVRFADTKEVDKFGREKVARWCYKNQIRRDYESR